ncbi:TauD/TfdA family dioxygenase [Gammaproteobacteria bacterium]|nr:TauD/TfdA family dioxygenase [Gammaproteobacteria bacterium]
MQDPQPNWPTMLTKTKIDHPNAWTTDSVCSKSDVAYSLSKTELADLDQALCAVKERGVDLEKITARDFPLTVLSPALTQWLHEIQERKGLILLSGFPADRYSKEDCGLIFWGIGAHMGEAQSQSLAGDRLGHVVNLGGKNARYRAYQNSTELALHTDATDIVGMMCLTPAKEGGLSGYAAAAAIYNELVENYPDALVTLCQGFHYHLFGEQAEGESPITEQKVPVFSMKDGYLSISYLRSYIEMAFAEMGKEKTPAEQGALDTLDKVAHGPRCYQQFMLAPGDILLFNNYTVLHNRTAFADDDDPDKRRHMLRLWLRAHKPRPIVDDISAFGKRAGIAKQTGRTSVYQGALEYEEYAVPKT